jgi:hypothetical protein
MARAGTHSVCPRSGNPVCTRPRPCLRAETDGTRWYSMCAHTQPRHCLHAAESLTAHGNRRHALICIVCTRNQDPVCVWSRVSIYCTVHIPLQCRNLHLRGFCAAGEWTEMHRSHVTWATIWLEHVFQSPACSRLACVPVLMFCVDCTAHVLQLRRLAERAMEVVTRRVRRGSSRASSASLSEALPTPFTQQSAVESAGQAVRAVQASSCRCVGRTGGARGPHKFLPLRRQDRRCTRSK